MNRSYTIHTATENHWHQVGSAYPETSLIFSKALLRPDQEPFPNCKGNCLDVEKEYMEEQETERLKVIFCLLYTFTLLLLSFLFFSIYRPQFQHHVGAKNVPGGKIRLHLKILGPNIASKILSPKSNVLTASGS